MTLTDEELDRIAGFESFDRCPATLQDLIAQAKEANRLRDEKHALQFALTSALDGWAMRITFTTGDRRLTEDDDKSDRETIARLRKLTETK